jgi:hypothetical protein
MKTSGVREMSTAFGVTKVPSDLKSNGKTNYLETKTMYKKLRTECQKCFVYQSDEKYTISIDQMEKIPKDWTI